MVTLIIPPSTNLSDLRQTMKKEAQTASNIKSSSNRKSVQSALSCVNEYLKTLKNLPDSGIALFAEQYI
jgi:peptide chain release factor subunit 1